MNTKQLEREIRTQVNRVYPELDLRGIYFSEGTENSPEGTYVYSRGNEFHVVFIEKGKRKTQEICHKLNEVLWNVLETVLFDVAMDYALKHRVEGKDFRRPLFKKEVELYGRFSKEFENRKRDEINQILKENPYNDQFAF